MIHPSDAHARPPTFPKARPSLKGVSPSNLGSTMKAPEGRG